MAKGRSVPFTPAREAPIVCACRCVGIGEPDHYLKEEGSSSENLVRWS
jgi:hypothetical protein